MMFYVVDDHADDDVGVVIDVTCSAEHSQTHERILTRSETRECERTRSDI